MACKFGEANSWRLEIGSRQGLIEPVFFYVFGDGPSEHFVDVQALNESVTNFGAADVHEWGFYDVFSHFFDPLRSPEFGKFCEIRGGAAGSEHDREIALVNQIEDFVPVR